MDPPLGDLPGWRSLFSIYTIVYFFYYGVSKLLLIDPLLQKKTLHLSFQLHSNIFPGKPMEFKNNGLLF